MYVCIFVFIYNRWYEIVSTGMYTIICIFPPLGCHVNSNTSYFVHEGRHIEACQVHTGEGGGTRFNIWFVFSNWNLYSITMSFLFSLSLAQCSILSLSLSFSLFDHTRIYTLQLVGLSSSTIGMIPAYAAYFYTYDLVRERLSHSRELLGERVNYLTHAIACIGATIFSSPLAVPMFIVKARTQLGLSFCLSLFVFMSVSFRFSLFSSPSFTSSLSNTH